MAGPQIDDVLNRRADKLARERGPAPSLPAFHQPIPRFPYVPGMIALSLIGSIFVQGSNRTHARAGASEGGEDV